MQYYYLFLLLLLLLLSRDYYNAVTIITDVLKYKNIILYGIVGRGRYYTADYDDVPTAMTARRRFDRFPRRHDRGPRQFIVRARIIHGWYATRVIESTAPIEHCPNRARTTEG